MARPGRRFALRVASFALAIAGAAMIAACSGNTTRRGSTLYEAVGGEAGVERIVAHLVERVFADRRIGFFFENSDRADVQRLIREQFCVELGGPCTYTGRGMAEAHGGLAIQHRDFEVFVEHFMFAMEDAGVPVRTRNRVLAVFAPMRGDVVDK